MKFVEAHTTNHVLCCSVALRSPASPRSPLPRPGRRRLDAQAIEMERQREKQMPCSAEWLKTSYRGPKEELPATELDQSGDECTERPSAFRKEDDGGRFRQ